MIKLIHFFNSSIWGRDLCKVCGGHNESKWFDDECVEWRVRRDYYIWKLEWPKHYGTYLWNLEYFGLWCESLWYLTSMHWCVCTSYALVWNEIMAEPCWFFGLGSVKWNLLVVFCSGVGAFMQTLEEFVLAIFSAFVQFP